MARGYGSTVHIMARNKTKSQLDGKPLCKVLVDGRSVHGGDFDYTPYLPTQNPDGSWTPGGWTPVIANVEICSSGYHLTNDPYNRWAVGGMVAYEAKGRLAYGPAEGVKGRGYGDDKLAFAQIQLLRPVEEPATFAAAREVITVTIPAVAAALLNPDGDPDETWSVHHTERQARHALAESFRAAGAAGAAERPNRRGNAGSANAHFLLALGEDIDDAIAETVANLGANGPAFPKDLVNRLAFAAANGEDTAVMDAELDIWLKGYGVAGRGADGTLYVYEVY